MMRAFMMWMRFGVPLVAAVISAATSPTVGGWLLGALVITAFGWFGSAGVAVLIWAVYVAREW